MDNKDTPIISDSAAGMIGHIEIPPMLLQLASSLHQERGVRTESFEKALFGEPAWDILLALYVAAGRGYSMKVSDACYEARVPPTTALRWIEVLQREGHLCRVAHPMDARSSLVEMTSSAIERMNNHLWRAVGMLSRV